MPQRTDSQRAAMVVRKAWAETLYMERHRQRLTQADVAVSAGIDQTTLSAAERGRASLDTFLAVAAALGVTLIELPEVGE